MAVEWEFRMEV